MPKAGIVFKPKYNGSMRFALVLWPVWAGLFFYFLFESVMTGSAIPQALLAFIFGAMTITLPLRVFREAQFGEEIVVKRYLMPDLKIQYGEITGINAYGLKASSGNISLQMLNHDSAVEFGKIINQLVKEKKIKLTKIS
jgi:hypothetical protein